MDELRNLVFCQQQKRKNEVLPPTSNSFRHHYPRQLPNIYLEKLAGSNARSAEFRTPCIGERRLLSKTGLYDEGYCSTQPFWNNYTCNCRNSLCQGNCSCSNLDLASTGECSCIADESCKNRHTAEVQYLPSDSEEVSEYDVEEDWEDSDTEWITSVVRYA